MFFLFMESMIFIQDFIMNGHNVVTMPCDFQSNNLFTSAEPEP